MCASNHILKDSGGELGEIYIAVVYPKSKETLFNRVIKQTMTSLSEDFAAATNLRIVPFYTVIGDTDGYSVLDVQKACEAWNHKPIVAALVFSSFRSGFAHVLTSLHNNIPVLWATGEVQAGYFERVSFFTPRRCLLFDGFITRRKLVYSFSNRLLLCLTPPPLPLSLPNIHFLLHLSVYFRTLPKGNPVESSKR